MLLYKALWFEKGKLVHDLKLQAAAGKLEQHQVITKIAFGTIDGQLELYGGDHKTWGIPNRFCAPAKSFCTW